MFNNKAEAKQRFSLRKLAVGVVSVLLGLTFLTYNGENVHADANAPSVQPKTEEVSSSKTNNVVEKSGIASTGSNEGKTPVESVKAETKNAAKNIEVKPSTPAANKISASQDENKTDSKADNAAQQEKTGDNKNTTVGNDTGIYIGAKAYQEGKKYIAKQAAEVAKQRIAEAIANYNNLSPDQKQNPASYEVYLNKPIPKEIVAKYFGLNKPDISETQLAKLGLAKDTFFVHDPNGKVEKVKLGDVDLIILSWDGRQKFQFEVPAIHEADGFVHFFHPDYKADPDPINQGYYIGDTFQIVESGPITEGKPTYININHKLDANDADRAIENGQSDAYRTGSHWLNGDVDITKAGNYEGHFEAFYKNGVGILTGVPVTVVDLQGQTVTGTLGQDIDNKVADIIKNPAKYINGIPAGKTSVVLLENPSLTKSSDVQAVVIYPDGNSGKATIHVIVNKPMQPTSPGHHPTQPTNQPTTPPTTPSSNPTEPTTPVQPTNNPPKPVNPAKPTQPSNVHPKPVRPVKPQTSTVKPKPVKPNKPGKSRTTKPIAQNGKQGRHAYGYRHTRTANPEIASPKSYSGLSNAAALKACNKVLPHTGNKGSGILAAIGAAFTAVAGFFGLAGTRRRRRF